VIMATLNFPLDYLFGILSSPSEDMVSDQTSASIMSGAHHLLSGSWWNRTPEAADSDSPAARPPLARGESMMLIDQSTVSARIACSVQAPARSTELTLRPKERERRRTKLIRLFHSKLAQLPSCDPDGDVEANSCANAEWHCMIQDIMLQYCFLSKNSDMAAQAEFAGTWHFGNLLKRDGVTTCVDLRAVPELIAESSALAKAKVNKINEMHASDAEIGVEIMSEFILDMIGRDTPVAKIFSQKVESHFRRAAVRSVWSKLLALCAVVVLNVACITYIVLKASIRGVAWQNQYIAACIVQILAEIVLFETFIVVWCEVVVPQLIHSHVSHAFRDVLDTLDKMCADEKASVVADGIDGGSRRIEQDPSIKVVNTPEYFFVSHKMANLLGDRVESGVVTRYESMYPSKDLLRRWNPGSDVAKEASISVDLPSWITEHRVFRLLGLSMLLSFFITLLVAFVRIPMQAQVFVLSTVQPFIFTAILIAFYTCLDKPVLFAAFAVVLLIVGAGVYYLVRSVSASQRSRDGVNTDISAEPVATDTGDVDGSVGVQVWDVDVESVDSDESDDESDSDGEEDSQSESQSEMDSRSRSGSASERDSDSDSGSDESSSQSSSDSATSPGDRSSVESSSRSGGNSSSSDSDSDSDSSEEGSESSLRLKPLSGAGSDVSGSGGSKESEEGLDTDDSSYDPAR